MVRTIRDRIYENTKRLSREEFVAFIRREAAIVTTEATRPVDLSDGSDNIFADLGLPDADGLLVKADLAIEIGRVLDERRLPKSEAARVLRTSQPRISDLRRGKLEGFTIDRLLRFLNALD